MLMIKAVGCRTIERGRGEENGPPIPQAENLEAGNLESESGGESL